MTVALRASAKQFHYHDLYLARFVSRPNSRVAWMQRSGIRGFLVAVTKSRITLHFIRATLLTVNVIYTQTISFGREYQIRLYRNDTDIDSRKAAKQRSLDATKWNPGFLDAATKFRITLHCILASNTFALNE